MSSRASRESLWANDPWRGEAELRGTATKLGAQTEQGDTPEGPHMTLPASVMAAQQQRLGGQEVRWSMWMEGFIDRLVTGY